MHGDTLTLLLCIVIGFTTWQGLNRPGVMERYLFSAEQFRLRREWLRLISPAFLHGSWGHFAGNAITLFFFGRSLENALGPGVLLGTFFISVAGGHALCLLLHKHEDYRAIGASGGALGILFSTILLFPGMTLLIFPIPIPIPGWLYALGFLFYTLSSMRGGSGVSHEAHLGGMLTGVAVTLLQHPSLFLSQPLLIVVILGISGIGIWYFHANPGRVPGFFRMALRDRLNALSNRSSQKRDRTVDELLDKVSREGIQSLTPREREILQQASKQRGGRR
jgi:membrane associated rhomboid family serine protease